MSAQHPIIAVTGSSGAGTSSSKALFARLFQQLGVNAAVVGGDSFHAYDRQAMRERIQRAELRGENFSHFGPAANLFERLEALFKEYGSKGTGYARQYVHTEDEADIAGYAAGTFTPWEPLPYPSDVLFYEGLHGGLVSKDINVAKHVDLLVGVVPIINLEWIQKIQRDHAERGQSPEAVTQTILRRMSDYVNYLTPQFSRTDVNFQRVPLVDTSNPFALNDIPSASESLTVIHLNPHSRLRCHLPTLVKDIEGSYLTRPQTWVVPGLQVEQAMERLLLPAVQALVYR